MEQISLNGATQKTHKLIQRKEAQFSVIKNMALSTKIKCDLIPDNEQKLGVIPTMSAALLLEAQDKIDYILNRKRKIFNIKTVKDTSNADIDVIEQASLDLGWDGEVSLGEKDTMDISLSNLGKVAQSTLFLLESRRVARSPYIVKTQTFDSRQTDLNVNLNSVDLLVFDIDKVPNKISLIERGNPVKYNKETLLLQQADVFGVIGYENNNPIIGSKFAIVLPVSNATSVVFEDETENRSDYKFYAIQVPKN